jgi:hypothetical protein
MILNRRQLVLSALGASAMGQVFGQGNPGDTKLAHRLTAKSVTEDDLLFLQQLGLKWVRLEFGEGPVHRHNRHVEP